jgi:hypothetical protein
VLCLDGDPLLFDVLCRAVLCHQVEGERVDVVSTAGVTLSFSATSGCLTRMGCQNFEILSEGAATPVETLCEVRLVRPAEIVSEVRLIGPGETLSEVRIVRPAEILSGVSLLKPTEILSEVRLVKAAEILRIIDIAVHILAQSVCSMAE